MTSRGQGLGTLLGAIIGTIITPGAGTLIGAGIGGTLGGLVDPVKAKRAPRQKFQEETITFNTFDPSIPVPILFGTFPNTPNVIFIGDSFSQVEVVGSQTTGAGKNAEEADIEKLIYYADFAIAVCEGEIQRIDYVFRGSEDITGQEGEYFTISLGADDEGIPDIVTNSPVPIQHPVAWRNTAKVFFSGRLGEVNRIPPFRIIATGPDLTVTDAANLSGMPSSVLSFYHDDLTDLVSLVSGSWTVVSCGRDGSNLETAEIPNIDENEIDVAAFDGRTATMLILTKRGGDNTRRILRGERGWTDTDDWETSVGYEEANAYAIDGWTIDDSGADDAGTVLWTLHKSTVRGAVLMGTSFVTGEQKSVVVPLTEDEAVTLRALWFDKPFRRFYVLYSRGSSLRLLRFSVDDPGDREEQAVDYGYADPIAVWRVGEMIGIFDSAKAAPLHYFEFGRNFDRFTVGTLDVALNFDPNYVANLAFRFRSDSLSSLADGDPVGQWPDSSSRARHAFQGTATEQPTYRAAMPNFNGHPIVEFDGTADDLDQFLGAPTVNLSSGFTIFMVIRPLGSGASTYGNRIFSMRNQPSQTPPTTAVQWLDIGWGASTVAASPAAVSVTGHIWIAGTGIAWVSAPVAANEAAIIAIRVTQTQAKIWKNGVLVSTFATSPPNNFGLVMAMTASVFVMGRWVGSAINTPEQGHTNVQIAELAAYERNLSDEEIGQVNGYLRARYRIAADTSYGAYLTAGTKLAFGNPQQAFFSPGLSKLFVLDYQTAGNWALYHTQWRGDSWSVLRETSYIWSMFDEVGSVGGAMWGVFTSERYGAGIDERWFRRYSFERVSGFCATPSDARYYTTDQVDFAARYQIHYLISTVQGLTTIAQEMSTAFNGYVYLSEGLVELDVERDLGYIDGRYDESNIDEGSFGFEEIGREDRYNTVVVQCFDSRNDYRQTPVKATAEWEKDIFGEVRQQTINGVAIASLRQAGNIAWGSIIATSGRRFACQFTSGAYGLRQKVGDVIYVTRPEIDWKNRPMRVIRIAENENEQCVFQCIDHVPASAETTGFPLQEPQSTDSLIFNVGGSGAGSNFEPVLAAARVQLIENTQTGEIWLFASRPDNSGPWASMRWHARWDQTFTPNALFYPGNTAFTPTAYSLFLTTSHFTPSGLLKSSITSNATTADIIGTLGTPPEQGFDVVIYNPAITSVQFANVAGNGMYERCQGSLYDDALLRVTIAQRGVGTTAVAHTVNSVPVAAAYTRRVIGEHENSSAPIDVRPVPVYWQNQTIPGTQIGSAPLSSPGDEYYIGFGSSAFVAATPNGVNNLRFVVSSWASLVAPYNAIPFRLQYTIGSGQWKDLKVEKDETNGFRNSGVITFQCPSDWVATDHWMPSGYANLAFFPSYLTNLGNAPSRYYLRIIRDDPHGPLTLGAPQWGVPGGLTNAAPRTISLENQSSNAANGYMSPTVYFLVANATPVYDFISIETGYRLLFKPQPVGVHNQSIPLDDIAENTHAILNLAGE